jgi:protein gp37
METAAKTIGHTFIILTKRPDRMRLGLEGRPNPFWIGATTENQARFDERVPHLIATPAAVHYISAEPLLGPLDLSQNWRRSSPPETKWPSGLDWVIAGPENGPHRRPCDPEWIADIQRQCDAHAVPFFDKRPDQKRKDYPWTDPA